MKANKAPEKIYLYPSDRAGEEYENEWGAFPWGEGSVEYVRTDAFIEKAREWRERIGTYIADNLEAMLNLACANVAEITYTITTTEG